MADVFQSLALGSGRLVCVRVLDHDQDVLTVWCHHNLMLLRPNPEESQTVLWVEVADDAASLRGELGDARGVLERLPPVEGGPDGHPLAVHDDDACHPLVRADAIDGLLDFRHGLMPKTAAIGRD